MGYGFVSRQNVRSTVRGSELQPATTVFLGGVKVDGVTITIADGVISAGAGLILIPGQGVTIDVAGTDYTFNIGQEVNTSSAVQFSSVVTNLLVASSTTTLHSSVNVVGTLSVSSNVFVTSITIANNATATSLTVSGNARVFCLGVGTAASGSSGEIRATNNITAYYSDQRLKENITRIENALHKVQSVSGVTFNANDVAAKFGYNNKNTQVGVIAQEIQAILPQIVVAAPFDIGVNEQGTEYSLSGENYLTVQYDKLVPLLIEAIKELTDRVTKLESSR
jgi:hypothetical protein